MKDLFLVLLSVVSATATISSARAEEELPYGVCSFGEQIHKSEYQKLKFDAAIKRRKPEIDEPYKLGLEFTNRFKSYSSYSKGQIEELIIAPMNERLSKIQREDHLTFEMHLMRLGNALVVQACSYKLGTAKVPVERSTCLSVDLVEGGDLDAAWKSEAERASWPHGKPMTEKQYLQAKTPAACQKTLGHEIAEHKIDGDRNIKDTDHVDPMGDCLHFPGVGGLGSIHIE